MNQISLIGEIARPPVYHCTAQGQDLLRFELRTKSAGEVCAHHCTAWGPAALDLHLHLSVGDRLLLRGELRYRLRKHRRHPLRIPEIHLEEYTYLGQGEVVRFTCQSPPRKLSTPG